MKQDKITTKSTRKYYVDIIAFLPFLLLIVTGVIMIKYHSGAPYESATFGLLGNNWIFIHKLLSVIAAPLVIIHLTLHISWIKKLFTFKLKNKHKGINITLFILFLLCSATSFLPWFIMGDSEVGNMLRGIHNKFGLLLIIFFIIHVSVYLKWIVSMTKKVFNGN